MKHLALFASAMVIASCTTTPTQQRVTLSDSAVGNLTEDELIPFGSERELRRYIDRIDTLNARGRNRWVAGLDDGDAVFANQPTGGSDDCFDEDECIRQESVVVTGSAISTQTSITNTQMAGVDEGDIIKLVGDHLIVLQDGRLFSVHVSPETSERIELTDRANIYRSDYDDTWYDEILALDDRIVVTGFSYDMNSTEISVIEIDESGQFGEQATFYMWSEDYYDTENYATRIVGDSFVIHTAMSIDDLRREGTIYPFQFRWDEAYEDVDDEDALLASFEPLVHPRNIYRPVLETLDPVIHVISVCDLSDLSGRQLDCRSEGFVAPADYEMFVTNEHVYLYTAPDYYELRRIGRDLRANADAPQDATPAVIYRMPVKRGDLEFAHVRGQPNNQFSMDYWDEEFRMLSTMADRHEDDVMPVNWLLRLSDHDFDRSGGRIRRSDYETLPAYDTNNLQNRFLGDHLVYASNSGSWWRANSQQIKDMSDVYVIEIGDEISVMSSKVPHGVSRLEVLGEDFVLTGYGPQTGLQVSNLDPDTATITSTQLLAGRSETEGRSHAFNGITDEDGSGIFGIPTEAHKPYGGRLPWRSSQSELSFLTRDADGQLMSVGELGQPFGEEHPDYDCEVSCVDWYGNSRPVFLNGRVFALVGTELVEGHLVGQEIRELARVNLTAPPPADQAS